MHAFLGMGSVATAIALLLTVLAWKMSASSANWMLVVAWILFATSIYTAIPIIARQPAIPRFLWTMLAVAPLGLALYSFLWTASSKPPLAATNPKTPDPVAVLARELAQANRPWLFIVGEDIDKPTGRIRLVVENKGKTPAYDVTVEDWGEISRQIPKYPEIRTLKPGEEFEAPDPAKMLEKSFVVEFDSRRNQLPKYGGRQQFMHVGMVQPGEKFEHLIAADPFGQMAKALKLEGQRHSRFVGEISYADSSGEKKPVYRFCYGFLVLRDERGKTTKRLIRCPDLTMNISR